MTIVPGYIGNQRIAATIRRRQRRIGQALVFVFSAGLVALVVGALLGGCGDNGEPTSMLTKTIELDLFETLAGSNHDNQVRTFSVLIQIPSEKLSYSVATYLKNKNAAGIVPPYANTNWTPDGTDGRALAPPFVPPVTWTLQALAPEGSNTKYTPFRSQACPDAWEDEGTAASRVLVTVVSAGTPWRTDDTYAPAVVLPFARFIVGVTFQPRADACFGDGEYDRLLARATSQQLGTPSVVPQIGIN